MLSTSLAITNPSEKKNVEHFRVLSTVGVYNGLGVLVRYKVMFFTRKRNVHVGVEHLDELSSLGPGSGAHIQNL